MGKASAPAQGKSDATNTKKRNWIIAGVIIFLLFCIGSSGEQNSPNSTPTPSPEATTAASAEPTPTPSAEIDKYALDTACAEEAIIKGYKAASFSYTLDHPVSVDSVGLFDKDGKEVLLVRGAIATSDKVDTQYVCYITAEPGAKPTVLEIDGRALDGSYLDSLYDSDGKPLREKDGES